jgi:protein ImuB
MHWIALAPATTDAHAATALGWWALQFTPRVALVEEAVLLEVSACERLWGGRAALVQKVSKPNPLLAGELFAQAATYLIAIALLRLQRLGLKAPHKLPDDLPLHTLSAAQPHLPTLERLGVRTWGGVRALPRAGTARRFGAALLEALDAAYGERPGQALWLELPEVFELTLELPALLDAAPELMCAAQRLLCALHAWLQARAQGVLALELVWRLDARRVDGQAVPAQQRLVIRTAQATQDMHHLGRLLSENLAHATLPAPAYALRLRSLETQAMAGHSASLLLATKQKGDSLHQLVERLGARLGADHVLQATRVQDHRPERMTQWNAVQDATKLIATCAINTPARGLKSLTRRPEPSHAPHALTWPTWLLREPRRLALRSNRPQYQGPLRLLAGPQRLEGGWWGAPQHATPAVRDYFVAQSEQAGLLWIYRERLPKDAGVQEHGTEPESRQVAEPALVRWFLHGMYA